MERNEFYEKLKENALDSENYLQWRKEHTKVFGALFSEAFSKNVDGQICLTAALINISSRNFEAAIPKLNTLEIMSDNDFDRVSICYFKGLNFEFMGRESEMAECYERVRLSGAPLNLGYLFHPYYRTAKLAQRSSECSKAVYYYRKALEFFEGTTPTGNGAAVVSHVMYDLATVFLYMHEYQQCERFIDISCQYDKSNNQERDCLKAILYAVQGKKAECEALTVNMNAFLKGSCKMMTSAILDGGDLHYCTVLQDGALYPCFWDWFVENEGRITDMISNGNSADAEKLISERLTSTFPFARRPLECRIEMNDDKIIVKCKNYRIKTLVAEHYRWLALKPDEICKYSFLSVNEFENYSAYK